VSKKERGSIDFINNFFDIKHPFEIRVLSISFIIAVAFLGMVCLGLALDMINVNLYGGKLNSLLLAFLAISIWGVITAIFPNKMKLLFFLYSGISSFMITVCLVVSYIIIVCKVYGLPPVIFATFGILLPLAVAVLRIFYRNKIYRERKFTKRGKPIYGVIAVFSMLGLGAGKVLLSNSSKKTGDILFGFLLILLACVFAALIELIYRYFLSLRYKDNLK
jgi:hypothetical protein